MANYFGKKISRTTYPLARVHLSRTERWTNWQQPCQQLDHYLSTVSWKH